MVDQNLFIWLTQEVITHKYTCTIMRTALMRENYLNDLNFLFLDAAFRLEVEPWLFICNH